MKLSFYVTLLLMTLVSQLSADTIKVPQDQSTIQAAIEASSAGDLILVAPGRYFESIKLKPAIILRSEGTNEKGELGLLRAEVVILDGGGEAGGIVMAAGSTLDGFTVTNVGKYDEARWQKHFDTHGEQLTDEEGSLYSEGTTPAISVSGIQCTVTDCIVHHNGDVGIGVNGKAEGAGPALIVNNVVFRNMGGGIGVAEGAVPLVRFNRCYENLRAGIGCRKASPVIAENICFGNVRAGIGCREESTAVIRMNTCFKNQRAGIGIRMKGTSPVVELNECYENELAGIGCRTEASPTLRKNNCYKNKQAGIGCNGASPLMVENRCTENALVGIGIQGKSQAILHGNKCINNRLPAIAVTGESNVKLSDNELTRTGGMPPLLVVQAGCTATISNNRFSGGGIAALMIMGKANVCENKFQAISEKQGNAIWVRSGATASISDNEFDGYRSAVSADHAKVLITGNTIRRFQRVAIIVKQSPEPAHVIGNRAYSDDSGAKVIDIQGEQGEQGVVEENVLSSTESTDSNE